MPLVRVEVRNEYGLGSSELYKEASRQEDPKAVLDGLAVSGLVGILRQLGDLAEFAAEVFHGLQEQVMTTSSRSHRLMVRVQNIEAALPSLEKAVLAQTSHIHFAYTAGSEWHPRMKKEQNHFIYNDLPRFIMDSYEECRDPPRLHMLDKFDTGGPGSCLKRYSDPTFFRRVSGGFKESDVDKVQKDKKARKSKKKRSSRRNGDLRSASMSNLSGRMQFATPFGNGGRASPSYTTSTIDMTLKSDMGDRSNSFDSRMGSSYIEHVFHSNSNVPLEEHDSSQVSLMFMEHDDIHVPAYRQGQHGIGNENLPQRSSPDHIAGDYVTWDEKEEITEPRSQHFELNEGPEMLGCDSDMDMPDDVDPNPRNSDMDLPDDVNCNHGNFNMDMPDDLAYSEDTPKSSSSREQLDEVESEPDNYMDALNTIESESENDLDFQRKHEEQEVLQRKHEVPSVTSDEAREHQMSTGESPNLDYHPDENELHGTLEVSQNIEASANPVLLDTCEHEETSRISGPSSISDSLLVTDDAASTIALVDVKLESAVSCPTSSGSVTENACELLHGNKLSTSSKSQVSMVELPAVISNDRSQESAIGSPGGTSISKLQEPILRHSGGASVSKSEEPILEYSGDASVSKSQEPLLECSGDASVSESREPLLEYSGDALVSKPQESVVEGSGHAAVSVSQESAVERSRDASVSKSQESKVEPASVTPITIWTNGGLLGLQPSKPPDFAMSAAARQDVGIRSKGEAVGPPNNKLMSVDEGKREGLTPANSANGLRNTGRDPSSKCSTSGFAEQDPKVENSSSSHGSYSYGDDYYSGVLQPMKRTEKEVAVHADSKGLSTKPRQENDESSSRVFGLGHRLLVNGLRRTLSLGSDGKSEPLSSLRTNAEDQSSGQDRSKVQATSGKAYNEGFRWNLTLDSPSSSPPLEHMKISFHPADGFDVSKLKLKFPDGSHSSRSVGDAFPSFQLVPENVLSLHDVVSASDDDTFCRSSPYMSDDCFSQKSDLDSELWESEEPESILPSQRTEEAGTNGVVHLEMGLKSVYTENGTDSSLSATVLDLPSFDSMSTVMKRNGTDNLEPRNILDSQPAKECPPLPPPLPPAQWRVPQIPLDESKDQKHSITKVQTNAKVLPATDLSQLMNSKPALPVKRPIQEKSHSFSFSKQDEHKLQQKEAFQLANIKDSDEKDDFLRQIRTKSFSLKRTVTAKPVLTSGPANDKVTAILKKANAIRQAVGSDDGENDDDNWSE